MMGEMQRQREDHADDVERPAEGDGGWLGRLTAYAVLPGLVALMAGGAGYLKWRDGSAEASVHASQEAVAVASRSAIAMLSYQPDTAERDLGAARDRLAGSLKDSYESLIHDVVIPGSKQKRISAQATVPAAASVSASESHAVVLLFVDQTVTVGEQPPSDTNSRVRVTLDKVADRWLLTGFDPI
ncbi:hypothetical protein ACQ856_29725 (plasmid) [Mycolicibacterium psychrotolerans]|uniref:hypothetical protein n=1 Tax=Mycolicibacterium psychrotolerans TaxID=216929 RepID=UPI003D67106A